jgi:methylated-DNA-[protein]-cysteine S-methyltransferase
VLAHDFRFASAASVAVSPSRDAGFGEAGFEDAGPEEDLDELADVSPASRLALSPVSPLAESPASRVAVFPASPMGAARPPSGTVAASPARVGDGFVTTSHQGTAVDPGAVAQRVRAFLAGEDARLDEVPLELGATTPFQRDVTSTLRAVPRGEVVTYGELAAIAGYPGAQRAVGTLCATNRFMFLVPCHRVVAAGGIGGYGSAGVAVKRRLLALEGVEL